MIPTMLMKKLSQYAPEPKAVRDFLLRHGDFICGMGVFAFPNDVSNYRVGRLLQLSDEEALASDWEAVGCDLRIAMNQFGESYGKR